METRPVVRVVEKRKGEPIRPPPKIQRYRAGRKPDAAAASSDESSSSSEDDEEDGKREREGFDRAGDEESSSSDEEVLPRANAPMDLSSILDSIHAHDEPQVQSDSSGSEDDEPAEKLVKVSVPDHPGGLITQPIRKRLTLKSNRPCKN